MRPVQISLRILEALGGMQPAGVTELARALELPKSTVQRVLTALSEAGWIELREPALARWSLSLKALLAFVETQVKAGRSREEILAMREPLAGFESFGRFGQPGPWDALTCAYEEVTTT